MHIHRIFNVPSHSVPPFVYTMRTYEICSQPKQANHKHTNRWLPFNTPPSAATYTYTFVYAHRFTYLCACTLSPRCLGVYLAYLFGGCQLRASRRITRSSSRAVCCVGPRRNTQASRCYLVAVNGARDFVCVCREQRERDFSVCRRQLSLASGDN